MPTSDRDLRAINAIRALSIDMVAHANSGHPGMPLGAAPQAYVLWTRHLRHNPRNPQWIDRDRFVLSAGHASAMLYSLLYLCGYDLTLDDLRAFRRRGSRTPGHPEYGMTPGVEATTGPLGQGIGNAVGMAIAQAHLAAAYNRGGEPIVDHYTYVMAGDGDMMEGVAYEAASLAGHLRLGKLVVLYDDNRVSLSGPTSTSFTEDVGARYAAFGWHVQRVESDDGNDVEAIDAAIVNAKRETERPSLVIVRSCIGYASPRANTFAAHGEPLGEENMRLTKERLQWPLDPPFFVPEQTRAQWLEVRTAGEALEARWNERYARWKAADRDLAARFERSLAGELAPDLPWPHFDAANGALATRESGGIVMNAIAAHVPQLIGGSADLDPSTKTYLKGQGDFAPGSYEGRNIQFGVREHAMGAAINGIALHGGLLPFGATFFNFADYLKPAIRLAALSELHEILIFTHDSVFLGEDGPTHEPIEQLAMLRAQPGISVIRPADAVETVEAWKIALGARRKPTALILTRQKVPFLGDAPRAVARGAYVLREATGPLETVLIASGSEVALALAAADLIEARGVGARVVSMPSWDLFAAQDRSYRESVIPPEIEARVSIEAASTLGWERWIGARGAAIGIDRFGLSAPGAEVAQELGFTPERVAQTALALTYERRASPAR